MSRIVVIGGGHNGLCCAAYLARDERMENLLYEFRGEEE